MLTSITEIDSLITTSLVIGLTQDPYDAVIAAMFYNNGRSNRLPTMQIRCNPQIVTKVSGWQKLIYNRALRQQLLPSL